ncbi:imine reductase family protein [Streptomyces melanosporofaciens]
MGINVTAIGDGPRPGAAGGVPRLPVLDKDAGFAALYDVAPLNAVYGTFAGTTHAFALIRKKDIALDSLAVLLAGWLVTMAGVVQPDRRLAAKRTAAGTNGLMLRMSIRPGGSRVAPPDRPDSCRSRRSRPGHGLGDAEGFAGRRSSGLPRFPTHGCGARAGAGAGSARYGICHRAGSPRMRRPHHAPSRGTGAGGVVVDRCRYRPPGCMEAGGRQRRGRTGRAAGQPRTAGDR